MSRSKLEHASVRPQYW